MKKASISIIAALTVMIIAQSIFISKNKGEQRIISEVIASTSSETIIKTTEEEIISISPNDNIVAGDTILCYKGDYYLKL